MLIFLINLIVIDHFTQTAYLYGSTAQVPSLLIIPYICIHLALGGVISLWVVDTVAHYYV